MSVSEIPSERPVPEALRWYYYIHLCGTEGTNWIEEYDKVNGWEVAKWLDSVIGLCRRNRIEEARALLAECHDAFLAAHSSPVPSVVSVMRRWYLSTEAYLLYHLGRTREARDLLEQSTAAIRDAVSQSPFLIGLAVGCVEFAVHYARLARDERRWEDMRHHIAIARGMYRNEHPLCELAPGKALYLHDVHDFISKLSPRSESERESLAFLCNPRTSSLGIELLIRRIEAPPYMVVPCG